jgi:hypothetical protein
MYRFVVDYRMVDAGFLFTVQYYFKFKVRATVQGSVLCVLVFIQLLAQITFTLAAGLGFCAVLTKRGGYGLLVHPEIQDDKAFAEGLPQHAYQKHYRPPFIQNTFISRKDIR